LGKKNSYRVSGKELLSTIEEIIKEGNIRRIRIIHNGKPLIDIPLTIGVGVGALTLLAAPQLAAIGVIAALVAEVTVEVEKVE